MKNCLVRYRAKGAENNVQEGRGDAEAQFGSPVVVQQMVLFQISHHSEPASAVVALKMEPFVAEITR